MFGKILDYKINKNKIYINFLKKTGIVEVISSDVIRLYEENESVFKVDNYLVKDTKFEVSLSENLSIITENYHFVIEDNFKLKVIKNDKVISYEKEICSLVKDESLNELLALEGHKIAVNNNSKFSINKVCNKDDYLYGLGEKTGYFNKKGYDYEMWNSDIPDPHCECMKALYKSIPFYITFNPLYCYGFFFDNTYKQTYDMAKSYNDIVSISFKNGYFNYYFIGGNSIKEVVSNYTHITGKTPLPQRFTLGHQQCRWSYMNEDEVLFVANKYRELNIPCDTIFLDIDYMERYKVFTYNRNTFANFKDMIKKLKEIGFKIVTIIDPGVKVEDGYNIYEEAIKNNYAATLNNETYVNAVWPGDSIFPAFTDKEVRSWWGNNIKFLVDCGVDGVWNDMNEPASFKGPLPDNVEFKVGNEIHYHDEVHNVYGHYMAVATYDGLIKHTNKRPYIITRACYAGTQKYSTIWTGDNQSIWPHLEMAIPMLLNIGLSGFSFVGTDVGGFGYDCTKELLCRWSQLGAFTPLFRNHSAAGTRRQEPWTFDDETIEIYRKSVEIRYELIPYFYDLFYESSKTGLPLWRPLVMNYPNDKNTYEINDEFLLGDNMLVAPIVKQGAKHRVVYLPEGVWYNYFTNEKYNSGYHLIKADLNEIPVYVKEGAIIPTQKVAQYIDELDEIIFKVYPGNSKYIHYQDNGIDFKYQDGQYNLYEISHNDDNVKIDILHKGYKEYKNIKFKFIK